MKSKRPTHSTHTAVFSVGAGLVCAVLLRTATAQPYLPNNDDQVLERLPDSVSAAALNRLQADVARSPEDPALAVRLARQHIEQARSSGDPRHLGRAEAVLSPWWDTPAPPPEVHVMRAILHQANHDFDRALTDLDAVLARDPGNAQGWLTRASIHQVRGDYARARNDCHRLVQLRQEPLGQICLAEIASLNGRAEPAYRLLERLSAEIPAEESGGRHGSSAWIEGLLADIAERRGDAVAAERHYHAALSQGKADMFLLTAYADFLLDHDRAREVIALLEPHRDADCALLRLALAARESAHPQASAYREELRARFAASRLRGGNPHLREEARFTLSLLNDPHAALPLAVANWAVQREPVDTRLLLEAALAARQPDAARPALAWLEQTGMEDVRLHTAVSALKE